ncbi:SIMPL domain-containing protein [Phormidium sp. CLA17]|uniref:SIMPL domain-containing protein n=1 Tax=Leptolyngbya sp. Cla-17 TaxID=2803751 RepID=UPI001492B217|nr:SIMPL domain-containing protein [Leptolyngbya sp. Cla-17]MBM0743578.1 SIMPL domain-containing protein [Leptolyngbya sp. Cla-17]
MKLPILAAQKLVWRSWKPLTITFGIMSLSLIPPAIAQEKLTRTLTVSGRGTEFVQTTLTQVRLGVEAQGKTANEVQQVVAQRSNAVVNLLRSRKVEKLETTGINLNPTYRYDNGNQTLTGYSASNIVSFRVETSKAGALLDDAVKVGATRVDGVSFVATEGAIAGAQKIALKEATQDAQAQADAVLGVLNLTRKDIVGIQINGAVTPPPRPLSGDRMELKAAASPSPVIGGEQEIEASVTLQISY